MKRKEPNPLSYMKLIEKKINSLPLVSNDICFVEPPPDTNGEHYKVDEIAPFSVSNGNQIIMYDGVDPKYSYLAVRSKATFLNKEKTIIMIRVIRYGNVMNHRG